MSRRFFCKRAVFTAQAALAIAAATLPLTASAYVGPGAGLSLLSALWGLLCAIGAAFLFILLWPLRRLRRRRREARAASQPNTAHASDSERANDSERPPQNTTHRAHQDSDSPRA